MWWYDSYLLTWHNYIIINCWDDISMWQKKSINVSYNINELLKLEFKCIIYSNIYHFWKCRIQEKKDQHISLIIKPCHYVDSTIALLDNVHELICGNWKFRCKTRLSRITCIKRMSDLEFVHAHLHIFPTKDHHQILPLHTATTKFLNSWLHFVSEDFELSNFYRINILYLPFFFFRIESTTDTIDDFGQILSQP